MKTAAILAVTIAAVLPIFTASAQEQRPGSETPNPQPAREGEKRPAHEPGAEDRIGRMKREIQELQQAGKREEAERALKELHAFAEKQRDKAKDQRPDEPKKRPESSEFRNESNPYGRKPGADRDQNTRVDARPPERLRHLLEAIQHLRAAGLNDAARDLEASANKMRESIERQAREGRPDDAHADRDHRENRIAERERSLDQDRERERNRDREFAARRELQERAARPHDDAGHSPEAAPLREMQRELQELREHMQKISRELQDLRAQSRRDPAH